MSEQRLDVLTFYSLFHQMGGKAVTQAVRCSFYRNLGVRYSPAHHLFQGTHRQIAAGKLIREQDAAWPALCKPVFCEEIQTPLGKDRITVPSGSSYPSHGSAYLYGKCHYNADGSLRKPAFRKRTWVANIALYLMSSTASSRTVNLIRCKYSREFPLYNHTRDNSIIP